MSTAEVISIGDELLSGETIDSNSSHIDGVLESIGWRVVRHQTVPDDIDRISDAYRLASQQAQVIISTGGLGPTQDDLTFEGLARAMGVKLELHSPTMARIEARFAKRGRKPTENNLRQAYLPVGVEVLDNDIGTAPGLRAQLGEARVFVLPGVPKEMRWFLEHRVRPQLAPHEALVRRTLSVVDMGESDLEASLEDIIRCYSSVQVGFRCGEFENQVKLLGRGPEAHEQVRAALEAMRRVLGAKVIDGEHPSIEASAVAALSSARQTVAVAESCTGGLVAKLLTDVPGASSVFMGGVVAYANKVKEDSLSVSSEVLEAHGAVSEPVARMMAEGAQKRCSATWGVSTTGVAGPGGGSPDKPVGTVWIGCAGPKGTEAHLLELSNRSREEIRMSTAKKVLDLLRRRVLALD